MEGFQLCEISLRIFLTVIEFGGICIIFHLQRSDPFIIKTKLLCVGKSAGPVRNHYDTKALTISLIWNEFLNLASSLVAIEASELSTISITAEYLRWWVQYSTVQYSNCVCTEACDLRNYGYLHPLVAEWLHPLVATRLRSLVAEGLHTSGSFWHIKSFCKKKLFRSHVTLFTFLQEKYDLSKPSCKRKSITIMLGMARKKNPLRIWK